MSQDEPKEIGRQGDRREKPWTFITNHAAVLSLLAKHPRITALEISREVGITERSVRLIVSDLSEGGYITKIREGRGVRYEVDPLQCLRHRTQQDVAVGQLIAVLSVKAPPAQADPARDRPLAQAGRFPQRSPAAGAGLTGSP